MWNIEIVELLRNKSEYRYVREKINNEWDTLIIISMQIKTSKNTFSHDTLQYGAFSESSTRDFL